MALSDAPPLRGLIIRADAERLIVQATTEEILRFKPEPQQQLEIRRQSVRGQIRFGTVSEETTRTIHRGAQQVAGITPGRLDFRGNDFLYDRDGRPVAYIKAVNVTSAIDRPLAIEIEAVGVPGVDIS